jgi:hypothetical protein
MKALGPRWNVMYQTLYRFTSPSSHASDFSRHADASGDDFVWQIDPSPEGVLGPMAVARELLWHLANAIDQRLGLGFQTALLPHKVRIGDFPSE